MTVNTVTTSSTVVDVPVYIRDLSGTSLGKDRPFGSRIQSFSIKVDYSPISAVSSVTFSRAGITATLAPTSEFNPSTSGSISLLDTFQETTNPIPFTLNAPTPGDKVAHLVFNLSASATPGTTITLSLDPSLTQLTDEGGSAATKESGVNLTRVNGAINVAPLGLTLSPMSSSPQVHSINAQMTATINSAVNSATIVSLSSSSPNVATVPSTVTIPAGATSSNFLLNPLTLGSTTITGTLPAAIGGGTSQANVTVVGPTISITPLTQTAPIGGAVAFTLTISTTQPTDTTATLTSSDTSVATVAPTVVIAANQKTATFSVSGVKAGSAIIGAALSGSLGGAPATANVDVSASCVTPIAPALLARGDAVTGIAYDVAWGLVSGATDYVIDEATNADFTGATPTTVTAAKATFTHAVTIDTRYYYRVRARNKGGSCDLTSPSSPSISVLVKASLAKTTAILPVVGSVAGAFGSFFKTSLQMYNPQSFTISGKILFHLGGKSGSDMDPSLAYTLAPGKTITYDDLLIALSSTGVGSADLIADVTSPLPITSVRVFNDNGTLGTSGFIEDSILADGTIHATERGVLIAPSDFSRFRMNIGVRTLESGATATITVRDRDGAVLKSIADRIYDPTYFRQLGASDALDGLALTGGETITFAVSSGSMIVYGSTTDNITNDPALQIARKVN